MWPGTDPPLGQGRIWRSENSGTSWTEITTDFPPPPPGVICDLTVPPPNPPIQDGCYSLNSIAVHPTNPQIAYVGTFGHENYSWDKASGQGIGVVRRYSTDGGNTWRWEKVNRGLCPDGMYQGCSTTAEPSAGSWSLFVGTITIDHATPTPNVYIATMNGLYKMPLGGSQWTDISPNLNPPHSYNCTEMDDCRRFESIAVSPNNPNVLYVGTSQKAPNIPGTERPARIYRSTDGGATWTAWIMPTPPNQGVPYRAWASQYRVRDIQVGTSKAYAVIEGSAIYWIDVSNTLRPGR